MKELIPHHSFLAKTIYFENSNPILIPELWVKIDSFDNDIQTRIYDNLIKTTDAKEFEPNSEFVISDDNFFA